MIVAFFALSSLFCIFPYILSVVAAPHSSRISYINPLNTVVNIPFINLYFSSQGIAIFLDINSSSPIRMKQLTDFILALFIFNEDIAYAI